MKKLIFLATAVVLMAACNTDGFKTTKTGIKYKFVLQNDDAQKPVLGDVMELRMSYTVNDSTIFNSADYAPSIPFKLIDPLYEGDIVEGMAMMGLGDSAIFIVSADSFFLKNVGLEELPTFIPKGSEMTFYISLLSIKSKDVYEQEQLELQKQKNALLEIQRNDEANNRALYLKTNNITTKPDPSGLIYVEKVKGSGNQAMPGSMVSVHYKGMLVDGTLFDSSYDRNQPIEFKMGGGQVIPGFEEGISKMRKGGKALLVIPSEIGYGEQELANIPAFSTLVYEVELVEVK